MRWASHCPAECFNKHPRGGACREKWHRNSRKQTDKPNGHKGLQVLNHSFKVGCVQQIHPPRGLCPKRPRQVFIAGAIRYRKTCAPYTRELMSTTGVPTACVIPCSVKFTRTFWREAAKKQGHARDSRGGVCYSARKVN